MIHAASAGLRAQPGTFRGQPLLKGLTISIQPRAWVGERPVLTIFRDNDPVVTAWVFHGEILGWRSVWGAFGSEVAEQLNGKDVCELMGWATPEVIA